MFKVKTVESVTATFVKSITDLRLIKEKNDELEIEYGDKLHAAREESGHAGRVLEKLEALLS